MSTTELLLIDLSGIAHAVWHMSGSEPDPSYVSTQVIARVRALASAHPHAAICCDSGASFRRELDPQYKANRDTSNRAPLKHQMTVACETLAKDGFPVWSAHGFEADDVIATATMKALAIDDTTVLIASADKDLLQLVSDRVKAKSVMTGNVAGPEEVVAKFGVRPDQMLDYLCLVGDASDNIKGADGIGPKTAAELLKTHGTLGALYAAIDRGVVPGVTSAKRTALVEFRERWPLVRSLVALRTDVTGFEFAEVAVEREAAPMVEAMEGFVEDMDGVAQAVEQSGAEGAPAVAESARAGKVAGSNPAPVPSRELSAADATAALGKATEAVKERVADKAKTDGADWNIPGVMSKPVVVASQGTALAPVDYSQQLEPRSMNEAIQLAQRMYDSRLFSAYGTPQAVLATVLAGRELGIPAMAALRAFHIIEGKPQLSAGAIQSLVIKSGKAQYFRCSERTAERATFVTKRGDDPEMALTYTIEEGKAAWPKDEAAWKKSGWGRNPADMLVARASSKLARLVYPDVVSGLYAPEEMD